MELKKVNNHSMLSRNEQININTKATMKDVSEKSIQVRTLYACVGEHETELSFEPNAIITSGKCKM